MRPLVNILRPFFSILYGDYTVSRLNSASKTVWRPGTTGTSGKAHKECLPMSRTHWRCHKSTLRTNSTTSKFMHGHAPSRYLGPLVAVDGRRTLQSTSSKRLIELSTERLRSLLLLPRIDCLTTSFRLTFQRLLKLFLYQHRLLALVLSNFLTPPWYSQWQCYFGHFNIKFFRRTDWCTDWSCEGVPLWACLHQSEQWRPSVDDWVHRPSAVLCSPTTRHLLPSRA